MRYNNFIFHSYEFDPLTKTAQFRYSFDNERHFREELIFDSIDDTYDKAVFERVLFFAFMLGGISYYKTFPTKTVIIEPRQLSEFEAEFFTTTYLHGLSQYLYENNLDPSGIATFPAGHGISDDSKKYDGKGTLVLQSGGKDSLLLAELLAASGHTFCAWYMTNTQSNNHPKILNDIPAPLRTMRRTIDHSELQRAAQNGGLNGHVPVTFITLSYALLDAVLHNQSTVLAAIGREGEEPHAFIGDLPVTHQWSKTWRAEQLFAHYVSSVISPDIQIGSPLRSLSELKIAQLFVHNAWQKYARDFSSCNIANYKQGHVNERLTWCGKCPKCANSFLLFAPFVAEDELVELFGANLFQESSLKETFKGLLGIEGETKPFECVGEIAELRRAYHLALAKGHQSLPFDVPASDFDIDSRTESQSWATQMLQ